MVDSKNLELKDLEQGIAELEPKPDPGNKARVLSVVYGFYFVFLSALLGASFQISQLDETIRVLTFFLSIMTSLSVMFVGLELSTVLSQIGVSSVGWGGFALVNVSLLFTYSYVVGTIITAEVFLFGFELSFVGMFAQAAVLSALVTYKYHEMKRSERELGLKISELDTYAKKTLVPSLARKIRSIGTESQLLSLLAILKEAPFLARYEQLKSALVEKISELGITSEISVALAAFPGFRDNEELAKLMVVDESPSMHGQTDSSQSGKLG